MINDCGHVDLSATPNAFGADTEEESRQLADRAFHLELDQALELDGVFHRELADEIVDETVDTQAHGLRFAQAALLHVEDLLGADLADAGLVLDGVARAEDRHG